MYVSHQFFVNPYNGDDANPGTRERPWETLKRAEAQVRFLRVQNTEARTAPNCRSPCRLDSELRPAQQENTEDQLENSRYMGFTITE